MKKLLVMAMAFMLVLSLNSTFVFATDSKINSVAELKKQISENMKDGSLSVNEKEYLKANTDERTTAQFINEKLGKAADILNGKETTAMETKADGTLYSKMALHTATDAFAHSTFYKPNSSWVRITHEPVNLADDTTFIGTRFLMAKEVKDNIIARHSKEKTDFIGNDFYCNNFLYQTSLEFRLNKLKSFAQSAGVTNTTILNNFDKID